MNKCAVLLVGDTGMLGQAIYKKLHSENIEVIGMSRSSPDCKIDLLSDRAIEKCLIDVMPSIVVNTAAIVSIDYCEDNPKEAYMINGRVPGILSNLSEKIGAYFVQISTDHFFLGDKNKKHKEDDNVKIVNEYARSKYIGECLSKINANSLIIRTNVVGYRKRKTDTFIEWIIRNIKSNTKMTLYDDFYTSSINSLDFACVLVDIIRKHPKGILNVASSDVICKKDFIIKLVKELYGFMPEYDTNSIQSVSKVNRANSIGLDTSRVEELVGYKMPTFEETIASIKRDFMEGFYNL